MKKVLLGTSAIALAGAFATSATAAEWNVRVGGYMEQYVAYGSSDQNISGDYDGIDSKSDAEIFFAPSITLDNGLKIGANVQLEANTSGDQIDESYLYVSGSFGQLLIGSENSAGYKMSYAAPNPGIVGINSGTMSAWIPFSAGPGDGGSNAFRGTLGATGLEVSANNDAQRITYFTPRFSGFQLGVSYARDAQQDSSSQVDSDAVLSDIFDVGANYVNSFGQMNIAVSGRWGIADDNSGADSEVWSVGSQLGFGGFTLGGAYSEQTGASSARANGQIWNVGVAYETGPWAMSIEYVNGENQDNAAGANDDETLEQFMAQLTYSIAKGVRVSAFAAWLDFDEDASSNDDIDGFVIGTALALSW
jgi:predicted porin